MYSYGRRSLPVVGPCGSLLLTHSQSHSARRVMFGARDSRHASLRVGASVSSRMTVCSVQGSQIVSHARTCTANALSYSRSPSKPVRRNDGTYIHTFTAPRHSYLQQVPGFIISLSFSHIIERHRASVRRPSSGLSHLRCASAPWPPVAAAGHAAEVMVPPPQWTCTHTRPPPRIFASLS